MKPDTINCPGCGNHYTIEQWAANGQDYTCPNCKNHYTSEQLTHAGRWTAYVIGAFLLVGAGLLLFIS